MLIEVRVQLMGTLKQDLDRVSAAIGTARLGMRGKPESIAVFGPVWERNDIGHVCAVRYRISDTHQPGNLRVWELLAQKMEFYADDASGVKAAQQRRDGEL